MYWCWLLIRSLGARVSEKWRWGDCRPKKLKSKIRNLGIGAQVSLFALEKCVRYDIFYFRMCMLCVFEWDLLKTNCSTKRKGLLNGFAYIINNIN